MRRVILDLAIAFLTFIFGSLIYLVWLDYHLPEPSLPAPKPYRISLPAPPIEVPEEFRGKHLTELHLFSRKYGNVIQAVIEDVRREGESPEEYYAQIEPPDEEIARAFSIRDRSSYLVFHLWHITAFKPEYLNVLGNPGGKCLSMLYNKRRQEVVRRWEWQ